MNNPPTSLHAAQASDHTTTLLVSGLKLSSGRCLRGQHWKGRDGELLDSARSARSAITDAALIDEALEASLVRYRSAAVDASYAAYDEHPIEESDAWGDLASFRRAAAAS